MTLNAVRKTWFTRLLGFLALFSMTSVAFAANVHFKRDPSFPDFSNPNRIQVITVAVSYDPDPKQVERRAWQTRVKETLDYAALAALLK